MKLEMRDGSVYTGTAEQCANFAKLMGVTFLLKKDERYFHFSESKGEWVRIDEMNTRYLKNAILKMTREWVENIIGAGTPQEMVNLIMEHNDLHLAALCNEMNNRKEF